MPTAPDDPEQDKRFTGRLDGYYVMQVTIRKWAVNFINLHTKHDHCTSGGHREKALLAGQVIVPNVFSLLTAISAINPSSQVFTQHISIQCCLTAVGAEKLWSQELMADRFSFYLTYLFVYCYFSLISFSTVSLWNILAPYSLNYTRKLVTKISACKYLPLFYWVI